MRFTANRLTNVLTVTDFDAGGVEQSVTLEKKQMAKLLRWTVHTLEIFMWPEDYDLSPDDDKDIAGPQIRQDLLVDGLKPFRVQDVSLIRLADKALRSALRLHLIDGLIAPVQGGYLRASLGKSPGHCAAQRAARAGDHHNFTKGIGLGGQMHGLVALDGQDKVIRPAILWNDGRTAKEVEYLNETIGRDKLSQYTANIAFAGFTAPKLLWMKENEPNLFAKIAKIMLPKDYLVYRLTGIHATDYSDASGMLLLDVENKCWSKEMCRICDVRTEQLPKLYESWESVGTLKPDVAAALGLPEDVVVCAGAGDNAAAAVGTGTVGAGGCNISLGTSGTIFISSDKFGVDPNNALHAFAHADSGYHLMGCMLSAASCNKWWQDEIVGITDYAGEQAKITPEKLGRNHVYFLPYLMGERSPINDTNARGCFIGMTMDTTRADMLQAVLEGVAFAIRDSFEVARSLGVSIPRSNICGGGSKSPLWKTIMANVLGIPLDIVATEQGPGYGGAILAMVGTGLFPSVQAACDKLVSVAETVEPDAQLTALYEERYQQFKEIYPTCKTLFPKIQ